MNCYYAFILPSSESKNVPLKYHKLSESAFPRIFENFLKKKPFYEKKTFIENTFLRKDIIFNFCYFKTNFPNKIDLYTWEVKVTNIILYFYPQNIYEFVKVNYTMQ